MSKFFTSCLLFLTLLNFSMAQSEDFPFIGVTISSQTVDLESGGTSVTDFGIRYGQQDLDWRTMFTFSVSGALTIMSAEIDKVLQDDFMGVEGLRPYVGLTLGLLEYDNDKGFFYGLNAGMMIYATDNLDADISYHYYSTGSTELINEVTGATIAVHYFY